MKNIIYISLLMLLTISCKQSESLESQRESTKNIQITDPIKKENQIKVLDDTVLTTIKNYYKSEYGGDDIRLVETDSDSLLEMTYYSIPEHEDESGMPLITIKISKKTKTNAILYGDVNHDQQDDLIVDVFTEGGGAGGNVWWNDIFVFINQNDSYTLVYNIDNWQIAGCPGFLGIEKIQDNLIYGESMCYAPEDGRCCPSLKYATKVKLENNKLVVHSKKEIKKCF